MQTIHDEVRDGVSVITMNRPPVNSLGHQLRTDIFDAIQRAQEDASVKAIVLTGNDRAFSGGADITEFGGPLPMTEPRLATLIELMENSAKPVVAAIMGVCLGGGLELALGAHYRIAQAQARIGLPEVKLGILPGGGGTQRLPRLVGVERSLNMIIHGSIVKASTLADTDLFEQVVDENTVDAAVAFARKIAESRQQHQRVRDIQIQEPSAEASIGFARNKVVAGKDKSLMMAQKRCIESVAATLSMPFDEGLKQEREFLNELLQSNASKALRHIFMAERAAAKIPGMSKDARAQSIQKVGVVGAGTMGGGIAMSFLNAGIPVVLVEAQQSALDRGLATIQRNYESTVRKGRLSESEVSQRLGLLTPTLEFEALADVDLVIEAVFEDMTLKQDVFKRLDSICKPETILASNTSYLNIDELGATTQRADKVLGLHFFSPANVMRLLEVVRGQKTSDSVLLGCMDLAKRIGKIAVVAGVCDGFIGNRMVARYTAAAHDLVVQGATPQQVDQALQDFGFSMGPFRMGDLAGLDIGYATRKRLRQVNPEKSPAHIADDLVEQGRLGQKASKGWYRYEEGSRTPIVDPETARVISEFRERHGVTSREITAEEIVERCVYALVNEGARILEEGIALRASDIDVIYLNGYGFPRQHGGPMFYADLIGANHVLKALKRFSTEANAPSWWSPAAMIESMAQTENTFTQRSEAR